MLLAAVNALFNRISYCRTVVRYWKVMLFQLLKNIFSVGSLPVPVLTAILLGHIPHRASQSQTRSHERLCSQTVDHIFRPVPGRDATVYQFNDNMNYELVQYIIKLYIRL